jgi:hypothetical protein
MAEERKPDKPDPPKRERDAGTKQPPQTDPDLQEDVDDFLKSPLNTTGPH